MTINDQPFQTMGLVSIVLPALLVLGITNAQTAIGAVACVGETYVDYDACMHPSSFKMVVTDRARR